MPAWYEEYPKEMSKNDLTGKKLRLLADKPPEDTEKTYLKRVKVMDTENSKVYSVLLTVRDIGMIIDILPGTFTFKIKDGEQWANVARGDAETVVGQ